MDSFFPFSLKRFSNDEGGIRTDTREIFSSPTSQRIKRNLLLQCGARALGARLRSRSSGRSSAGTDVHLDVAHATCSLAAATASTAVSHSKVRGSRACRSRVRFDSARAVSQSLARDVDARVVARATGVSVYTPYVFGSDSRKFFPANRTLRTSIFRRDQTNLVNKFYFIFLFTFVLKIGNTSAVS